MANSTFIPSRFRRAVALHVIKNFMTLPTSPPLMLGIHGPSGDGKTFQCQAVLHDMNIKAFLISGGQLESDRAGMPAQLIRETYIDASRHITDGHGGAVVLVNDIDTGVGNWGDKVQYTVNRQTVFGELMHLVDYPTNVAATTTRRVPIIVTGNDFTKLYEPLVRAGRMTSFKWAPTIDEKIAIVCRVLPELTPAQCTRLVEQIEESSAITLPIAFYSHLRSVLFDDWLWSELERIDIGAATKNVLGGRQPKLPTTLDFDAVATAAKTLLASGELLNHLQSEAR
jgi:SpoVK/Ycf46/Vps4 family AAA+-type ATPase